MFDNKDEAVKLIFVKYEEFVKNGGSPRVILVPNGMLDDVDEEWRDINDINYKKRDYKVPSQPDAIIFGIMVIEVDIDEIKVY